MLATIGSKKYYVVWQGQVDYSFFITFVFSISQSRVYFSKYELNCLMKQNVDNIEIPSINVTSRQHNKKTNKNFRYVIA